MIEELTTLDGSLEQLNRIGQQFVTEANLGLDFNIWIFQKKFAPALEMGVGKIWVMRKDENIVGTLGAIATDYFFSPQVAAIEAFWFVEQEHRGSLEAVRLLEYFERWADLIKSAAVHLAYMEGIHPEKMQNFLERRGYEKLETVYRKKL